MLTSGHEPTECKFTVLQIPYFYGFVNWSRNQLTIGKYVIYYLFSHFRNIFFWFRRSPNPKLLLNCQTGPKPSFQSWYYVWQLHQSLEFGKRLLSTNFSCFVTFAVRQIPDFDGIVTFVRYKSTSLFAMHDKLILVLSAENRKCQRISCCKMHQCVFNVLIIFLIAVRLYVVSIEAQEARWLFITGKIRYSHF